MSWIVLDASVILKLVLPEDGSGVAEVVFGSADAIAPDIADSEVTNALWKRTRRTEDAFRSSPAEARRAMEAYMGLDFDRRETRALVPQALNLGLELSHPIYDCFYLALAEREGLPFVTSDRALRAAVERAGWTGAEVLSLDTAAARLI